MMKTKHILITLLVGILLVTLGAYLKITHSSLFGINSSTMMSAGLITEFIAAILVISKLYKNKKAKEILNS